MITRIKNYFKKESKWSIASNVLFLVFLILLLIPDSRMEILPRMQRLLLFAPSPLNSNEQSLLSETDFEWQYKKSDGTITRLSEHKGKVIFINYWATWCPPCVAELPSINELHKQYKDKVEFIFLSGEELSKSNLFLTTKGYNIISDQVIYQQPKLLSSNSIPTTFIIDKKGTIILHKKGTAKWNSTDVKALLDKLLKE